MPLVELLQGLVWTFVAFLLDVRVGGLEGTLGVFHVIGLAFVHYWLIAYTLDLLI